VDTQVEQPLLRVQGAGLKISFFTIKKQLIFSNLFSHLFLFYLHAKYSKSKKSKKKSILVWWKFCLK
jgi:hypothetical protein